MDNLIFKCPACGEELQLMDIIGSKRLSDAVSWVDQANIYEEWARAIRDFEIKHRCQ